MCSFCRPSGNLVFPGWKSVRIHVTIGAAHCTVFELQSHKLMDGRQNNVAWVWGTSKLFVSAAMQLHLLDDTEGAYPSRLLLFLGCRELTCHLRRPAKQPDNRSDLLGSLIDRITSSFSHKKHTQCAPGMSIKSRFYWLRLLMHRVQPTLHKTSTLRNTMHLTRYGSFHHNCS